MIRRTRVMNSTVTSTTLSDRFSNWMTRSLPWLAHTPDDTETMTYEHWSEVIRIEHGVAIMDDEGLRRCRRDGRMDEQLSRRDAEGYFLFNSLVKTRRFTA